MGALLKSAGIPIPIFSTALSVVSSSSTWSDKSDENNVSKEAVKNVEDNMQARDTVTQTLPAICYDMCSKFHTRVNKVPIH